MIRHPYLAHRAGKRPRPSLLELRLLDRDLAAAGVHIPSGAEISADAFTRAFVSRAVRTALLAA